MPFWGLVITSAGFIVPSIVAFFNHKRRMAHSCGVLTLTSLLYHGTQRPLFKLIDMCYAHTIGGIYSVLSIMKCMQNRRGYDYLIFSGAASSLYVFYYKSCDSQQPYHNHWHMVFHLLTQATWVLHAIDIK